MLKLSKRTADQVRAFHGVDGVETSKTTITFASVEEAARIVENVYGASRGDTGKRQAVASVRRALLAAVQQAPEEEAPKVEAEAPKPKAAKGSTKSKGSAEVEAPKEAPKPFTAPEGHVVVDLPTAKIVSAVEEMLAAQETPLAAQLVADHRVLCVPVDVDQAAAVVSAITAHMSAIVKADRSANMYAEGKLRGVRSSILAQVPGSEAGLPQRKTTGAAKADKLARVDALTAKLAADRAAKAERLAAKEAAAKTA